MVGLTDLPMFGESRTIKLLDDVEEVSLNEEGKRKLEALNKACLGLKLPTKAHNLHGKDTSLITWDQGLTSSSRPCSFAVFHGMCFPAALKTAFTLISFHLQLDWPDRIGLLFRPFTLFLSSIAPTSAWINKNPWGDFTL